MDRERLKNLLAKYDVPGPRYTSYPTVPAWGSQVTAEDYRRSLGTLAAGEKLSLYFHLPFCENLCHFCGCTQVITKDHGRSAGYVQLLLEELNRLAHLLPKEGSQVCQLHFGGGSPNFLKPEELTRLVTQVRKHFQLDPDAEVAIEMHPRTSTPEFCENLKPLGFNRISLGVQDFDPVVQKLINRNQTFEMTKEMVLLLRKLGFDSFNFDLVYGLPGQSEEGWAKTLDKVTDLTPNRLAVYSYAHVPWIRPVQRTFADSDLPSPEMKLKFFEMAYSHFVNNGYRLIGMDHFALENDELAQALDKGTIHRNFMGYSTRADAHQIGFGMSAISYVGGNYFQNEKDLKAYEKTLREGKLATFRGMILNKDDAIRRDLIMTLMCRARVDISSFENKWRLSFDDYFRDDLPKLETFVRDSLLIVDKKAIAVCGEGFLFLRNMAMCFDPYLERVKSGAKTPVFSRTV